MDAHRRHTRVPEGASGVSNTRPGKTLHPYTIFFIKILSFDYSSMRKKIIFIICMNNRYIIQHIGNIMYNIMYMI